MHEHARSLTVRRDPNDRHRLRWRHVVAHRELPLVMHEIEFALYRASEDTYLPHMAGIISPGAKYSARESSLSSIREAGLLYVTRDDQRDGYAHR